jgi:effector-binding domain-containing protein
MAGSLVAGLCGVRSLAAVAVRQGGPVTDFDIRDLPEQDTVARRALVPAADLRQFFDETYSSVWAAIAGQGLRVTGPPFALYHGMPGETIDLEAGFPVEGTFRERGDLRAGVLPGCRVIVGMHIGPYERLASTWMAMQEWGREQGLERSGDSFWEVYVSDPRAEPDPEQWRTQLVQPVESCA